MHVLARVRDVACRLTCMLLVSCAWLGCEGHLAGSERNGGRGRIAARMRAHVPSPYGYEWFMRAELLDARGERTAAIEAYRMALASGDADPYVLARLARAFDAEGDTDAANRSLRSGAELDPSSEAIWLAQGDIARRHGQWEQALAAYEHAEVAAPSSPQGALSASAVLDEAGADARAIAVLERLAERLPQQAQAALQVRAELALAQADLPALLSSAASLAHERRGAALLRRGAAQLARAGRPALAIRLLDSLPPSERDLTDSLPLALALQWDRRAELLLDGAALSASQEPLDRAAAYLAMHRPARALEELARASEARGGDPFRYALLQADAQLAQDQLRSALELARIPPASAQYPAANAALGRALQQAGMPALAREVTSRPDP